MFAASPPCVTMPWMRASRRMCCRSCATDWYAVTSASSAFTPCSGNTDACTALPRYSTSTCATPNIGASTMSAGAECAIIATSMSSKQPARIIVILPPYSSSAGVPRMTMRASPGSSARVSAAAAPTPTVAMRLWPQACPISGSASYSAQMPMVDRSMSPLAAEGRLHAAGVLLHREPLRREERHELRVRVVFVHRQLGMRVDLARDADEVARNGIDRRLRALLRLVDAFSDRRHGSLLVAEVRLYRSGGCGYRAGRRWA